MMMSENMKTLQRNAIGLVRNMKNTAIPGGVEFKGENILH